MSLNDLLIFFDCSMNSMLCIMFHSSCTSSFLVVLDCRDVLYIIRDLPDCSVGIFCYDDKLLYFLHSWVVEATMLNGDC